MEKYKVHTSVREIFGRGVMELELTKLVDYALSHGASYADIRWVRRNNDLLQLWDGEIDNISSNVSEGMGIRVLWNGAWGFAATNNLEDGYKTVEKSIMIARQSARWHTKPVALAPVPVVKTEWSAPYEIDLRKISFRERVDLLAEADAAMNGVAGISQRRASMGFFITDQLFVSSEDARIEQHIYECGAGLIAMAADGNEVQHRSYPSSFQGNYATRGYEHILSLDLINGGKQCAEEAVALLKADTCESGEKTIILDSSLLTLQVHESIGHALELDRVLGSEASYAGTSFATPDKLGNFQYGSPVINITADNSLPGGLASAGFDDEGVPARRTELIKDGILTNYLTSRETAAELDLPVSSSMRADGWQRSPLIRISNVNLEPGNSSLDQMIADTEDGIFMKTTKVYSIDDKRMNFEFGPEIAWKIENGKCTDLLKNVRYRSFTPEFWNSCDAVARDDEWKLWGVPVCGKGEPGQIVHVGHGTAAARFRNIHVEGIK